MNPEWTKLLRELERVAIGHSSRAIAGMMRREFDFQADAAELLRARQLELLVRSCRALSGEALP